MTPRRTLAIALIVAMAALPQAAFATDDDDVKVKKMERARIGSGHGWLGVRMQSIEGGLAEALDLDEGTGVLVGQVIEDSPAEKAGLASGDIIVRVDDEEIEDPSELRDLIRESDAGDVIQVHVLRDGSEKSLDVTLEEGRGVQAMARRGLGKARQHLSELDLPRDLRFSGSHGFLGVVTQELAGDLAGYFGVEDGALVSEVVEDSPAEKLGLQAGDIITRVAGEDVEDPGDLRRIVGDHEEAAEVEVVWTRDKREKSGTVELEIREGGRFLGLGGGPHGFNWHGNGLHHLDVDDPVGSHRVLIERLTDDGELSEELEDLRDQLEELREEIEQLKSD